MRANPELAPQFQRLAAGGGSTLDDTSFIQELPAALAEPFKVGFSNSIDLVFLIAAGVVAIGFFVFLFLPQLALSNQSGIQARQGEAAGTATSDPGDPAEQATEAVGAAAPTSVPPPVGRPGDRPGVPR